MQVITNPKIMQDISLERKKSNITSVLVPTMGNLHQGHLDIISHATTLADEVLVSIYVNPTQFGPKEDFSTYPRTPDEDLAKLQTVGVKTVFMPSYDSLYPSGLNTLFAQVQCPALDTMLCSNSRPHFFTGVATIVTKLFNICMPDIAIFGEKDFQQLQVIRNICNELFIPIKILGYPTVRLESGLALSSRNSYMSKAELEIAPLLFKTLNQIRHEIEAKPKLAQSSGFITSLEDHAKFALTEYGFKVDYLDIVDSKTLRKEYCSSNVRIIAAVYLGKVRLIDNI